MNCPFPQKTLKSRFSFHLSLQLSQHRVRYHIPENAAIPYGVGRSRESCAAKNDSFPKQIWTKVEPRLRRLVVAHRLCRKRNAIDRTHARKKWRGLMRAEEA